MGYPQKIVTCCYCGSRAALVLSGKVQHELACSNCGAPLHDLKMLPTDRSGDRELGERRAPTKKAKKPAKPYKPKKQKKKKKPLFGKIFEEAFDFIEDVFD